MAGSASFLVGVVFLFAVVTEQTGAGKPAPGVFHLGKKIQEYVNQLSKTHKMAVSWWNMHGNHSHLIEFAAKYRRYKVTTTVGSLKYGNITRSSVQPKVVYTEWSHNHQPTDPLIVTIKRTKKLTNHYSWTTQKTFTVGTSLSIKAGLPKVVEASSTFSTNVSLSNTAGESHTDTETYSIEQDVTVPPMKSAKIEWIVTDVTQEIPWTAEISIEGWFAVWFREKVNGHYLWFYDVGRLEDPLLEHTEKGLRFNAKGVFSGITGTEAHLRVSQYDLESYGAKPTKVYTIPVSMHT